MAFIVVAEDWSEEGWNMVTLDKSGTGAAIGAVRATDCAGNSGTVCSVGNWRVDKQNPTPTHYNIQVQRNGIFNAKTSVGGAKLPMDLAGKIGNLNDINEAKKVTATARSKELTSAIQSALSQSVGTWTIGGPQAKRNGRFRFYKITGTFSS
jgi:hypothetical protein